MTEKHKTSGLLHALRELYLRFSKIELHRRIGLYRHNSGTNKAPDISTPLTRHIDKLASFGKQNGAADVHSPTARASEKPAKLYTANPPDWQPAWLKTVFTRLRRPDNISTSKKASDHTMGEKLKDSAWLHIHTALMQARRGETRTAKLHADIANGAIKEAAHFMNEEDYKVLCGEVEKALLELDEIS